MPAVRGSEIRARRQRTGVKLGPFAELAGVKYQTLANIECGSQKVASIEVIHLIARALPDTTAEELLAVAEEEPDREDAAAA
jgi:transcriptional regulator with XRE-family HTH domain